MRSSSIRRPETAPTVIRRQSLQLAQKALRLAEVYHRPHDMCQATVQVARSLRALDDLASAEAYLAKALAWAAMIPAADVRLDLLCEMAEVAVCHAESLTDPAAPARQAAFQRAREHAHQAAEGSQQASDAHWELKLLLRLSEVLNRCGDDDDATQLQGRALKLLGQRTAREAKTGQTGAERASAALQLEAPTQLM